MPRIAVGVRIRPDSVVGADKAPRRLENLTVSSDQRSIDFRVSETQHSFTFNRIFPEDATQVNMYEGTMRNLVEGALDGYNGCIFAYGQTGAGKTYTMSGKMDGDEEAYGLVPRTAIELFRLARKTIDSSYSFRLSVLEIYNEVLFDLLVEQTDALPSIAFNSTTTALNDNNLKDSKLSILELDSGVVVPNLRIMPLNSAYDALRLLQEAQANRAIAEHQLNQRSSRSHVIYTYYVTRSAVNPSHTHSSSDAAGHSNNNNNSNADPIVHQSKLHLVDLAGSERVNKTGSVGTVQKEANYINRSLSYLEQVVLALTQANRDHIPYRQSKLTHLVKDSLGGNCQTVLVACIWPRRDYAWETLSTMRFAARMKNVETNPVRNRLVSNNSNNSGNIVAVNGGQLRALQIQVEALKKELVMRDFIHRQEKISLASKLKQEMNYQDQFMQKKTNNTSLMNNQTNIWMPELTKLQRQQSSRNLIRYVLPINTSEDSDDANDAESNDHHHIMNYLTTDETLNNLPMEINSLSQANHYLSVMKRALFIACAHDETKLREAMVQAVACVHLSNPVPSTIDTLQNIALAAVSSTSDVSNIVNNNSDSNNPMKRLHNEEKFLSDILQIAGLAKNLNNQNNNNSSNIAISAQEDAASDHAEGEVIPLTSRTQTQQTPTKSEPFSPDTHNHLLKSNKKLHKETLFKEFTASEGAGKDWQKAYDDANEALKNTKLRQREIATYLNSNKADIDRFSQIIQELSNQLKGNRRPLTDGNENDEDEENNEDGSTETEILSPEETQAVMNSIQENKEKLDEVKRNYRTAYQEMQICKEQIEEMHSLKKRTMTALLTAFDAYYRNLYEMNNNFGNNDNNPDENDG